MKVQVPFLRSAYNYDRDEASAESGLACLDKTRTQQHMAEECDINTIVSRFGIGYEMPQGVEAPADLIVDRPRSFHDLMQTVARGREAFAVLPADVRTRFGNDPGAFVEFCGQDENFDQLAAWGFVLPEAAARRKAERDRAEKARIDAEVEARLKAAGKAV